MQSRTYEKQEQHKMKKAKNRFQSYNINKYNIQLCNDLMECQIHWARVVSSDTESLFTQYTKHTFYELQYALEGQIQMTVGNCPNVHLDESDFIVIPPDTYHQINGGDSVGSRFIMAFSIHFKNDRLGGYRKHLDQALPHSGKGTMRRLFELILEENYHDTSLRRHILQALLESFLLKILERSAPKKFHSIVEQESGRFISKRVAEICAFIHDNNGIGIQVSDVATHFAITERHLNRILREDTGKSPREIINHEKLKKIEELILSTPLSFREISELCGFSDEYAMNKFFRRYVNTTLSDFRRIKRRS